MTVTDRVSIKTGILGGEFPMAILGDEILTPGEGQLRP